MLYSIEIILKLHILEYYHLCFKTSILFLSDGRALLSIKNRIINLFLLFLPFNTIMLNILISQAYKFILNQL